MAVIMLHLLRCLPVIRRCSNIIRIEDFNARTESLCAMLWEISKDWCAGNKNVIPRTYLDIEINNRLQGVHREFSDADLTAFFMLVEWIYAQPESAIVFEHAMRLIQVFMDDRRVKPLALQLSAASSDDFNKSLDIMHKAHSNTRVNSGGHRDELFTPEGFVTNSVKRQATGVAFIDELFNGGTSPGELYGVVGPTGGGKTTIGCMLFAEIAKQHRHAAFMSYETEFAPQVTDSIYGYLANIPRDGFHVCSRDEMRPEYRKALSKALAEYGPWMHGCDMKTDVHTGVGCGGVPEIRAHLQTYEGKGEHIELVVIDQMLSLVDSYIMRQNLDIASRRAYMQRFTEELRDVCSDFSCCMLVLHQVGSHVKSKTPTRLPQMGDAAEDKSFENNMHFCLGMGKHADNGMAWLSNIKHRAGAAKDLVVEMDPVYARINWDKERFRFDSTTRSFVKLVDGDSDNSRDLVTAMEADKAADDRSDILDVNSIQ